MTARQLDIGLVACSRTKADRPVPARELYLSPLFRAARKYAENRYGLGQWLILSARYGLVDPDQVLAPYDLSLRQLTARQREAWGDRIAIELTDRFPAGTVLWFHRRSALPRHDCSRCRAPGALPAGRPGYRSATCLVSPARVCPEQFESLRPARLAPSLKQPSATPCPPTRPPVGGRAA